MRAILPLFALLCLGRLAALELPAIPASDRVLTREEVKNFWMNHIQRSPLPPKGTGLHPDVQRAHAQAKVDRAKLIQRIKAGDFDTRAQLARLEHNVDALEKLGDMEAAKATEERLHKLREHLATLAKLQADRELAKRASEALDRIAALEAEIATLESEIASASNLP